MTNPSNPPRRYRSHLLALEPRMMFDAAAAVVAQGLMVEDGTGDNHVPAPYADAHDGPPSHGGSAPLPGQTAEPMPDDADAATALTPRIVAAAPAPIDRPRPTAVEPRPHADQAAGPRYADAHMPVAIDHQDVALPATDAVLSV